MKLNQAPQIEALLQNCEHQSQDFINWLKMQPDYADLTNCAESQQRLKIPRSLLKRCFEPVQQLFWTDACALYGRAHVDEKLTKDAINTATVMSVANFINVITTLPFIFRCFDGLGIISIALSVVTSWSVLLFSNELGVAVVVRTTRERPGASAARIGFALINILLSLSALPGTALLLDRSGLADYKAQELIALEVQNRQTLHQADIAQRERQLADQKAECDALQTKLDVLAKDDPRRNGLYVRAFGTWEERNRDWSQVPVEQLPNCRQLERLRKNAADRTKQFDQYLIYLKYQVAQNGALLFLKQERHQIYSVTFNQEGLLRSGSEESRIAFELIGLAIIRGQWTSLGFSGFLFALSAVTSGAAIFLVSTYAQRQDVALSFDEYLYDLREAMFKAIERGLRFPDCSPPALSSSAGICFQLRFFALCAEQMRQSGMCRYPMFLEFIQDYKTGGGHHWQSKPHIRLAYYYRRILALCQDVLASAHILQQRNRIGDHADVASLIHTVANSARALELELRGVQSFLCRFRDMVPFAQVDLTSSLRTVSFTHKYLLSQEAKRIFLSQPDPTQRCYRYLSELQEAVNEITQTYLIQIAEAALALKIFP